MKLSRQYFHPLKKTILYKIVFIVIIFYFFSQNNIHSQSLSHIRLTMDEGLPSNDIYSLLQENSGFIWLGCDAGLFATTELNLSNIQTPINNPERLQD